MTISLFEPYRKNNLKYELSCSTPLQIKRPSEAVFQVPLPEGQLGNEIAGMGPRMVEAKQMELRVYVRGRKRRKLIGFIPKSISSFKVLEDIQ